MNIIFSAVFIISALILMLVSPNEFLSTLLGGATKSATLCVSLLSTYAVWLGLMRVWEDSGVSRRLSKALTPFCSKLFATQNEEALNAACMNLSVNLLGISGAATPYGVRAANLLNNSKQADYALCMLFVLNATSLQLIPTSMIGVRTALGSNAPADIVLPTIIASVASTFLGVALVRLFFYKKHPTVYALNCKTRGACTR